MFQRFTFKHRSWDVLRTLYNNSFDVCRPVLPGNILLYTKVVRRSGFFTDLLHLRTNPQNCNTPCGAFHLHSERLHTAINTTFLPKARYLHHFTGTLFSKGFLCAKTTHLYLPKAHFATSSAPGDSDDRQPRKRSRFRPIHVLYLIIGAIVGKMALYVITKLYKHSGRPGEEQEDGLVKAGFGQIIYQGFSLPEFIRENLDQVENFKVNDGDIFVVSFPKSGTTWVQEVVYLIQTNLNFEAAKTENMEDRFLYLEYIYPGIKEIAKKEGPRLIKSHMPFEILPAQVREGKCKIIYIARNPKDVIVSYYHFCRMMSAVSYKGEFAEFFEAFISNKVPYCPWWDHVREFWLRRNQDNVLFLTYEDMHRDLPGCITRISSFLKHPLSATDVKNIADHCNFDQMKDNSATNYSWWDDLGLRNKSEAHFLRKGQVGDWQNYYSAEMSRQVEQMCRETLEPDGLKFSYTLP